MATTRPRSLNPSIAHYNLRILANVRVRGVRAFDQNRNEASAPLRSPLLDFAISPCTQAFCPDGSVSSALAALHAMQIPPNDSTYHNLLATFVHKGSGSCCWGAVCCWFG